jgi:hypothetical protein
MEAHMPPDHQAYVQWNTDRIKAWARKIGPNTETTVKAIRSPHNLKQQGYKSCLALIQLADKYSVVRLEAACKKALFYTPVPSYKSVKTILSTGQDKIDSNSEPVTPGTATPYGFTRGAEYYERKTR